MGKTFKDRRNYLENEGYRKSPKEKPKEKRQKKTKEEILDQMIRDGSYGI